MNNVDPTIIVIAQKNNWGDPSGPYDPSDDRSTGGWYNPNGIGDKVTDRVNYFPWNSPDTNAPVITIISHSKGQHVTTSTIILSGTASDAAQGDNGIQQVMVNGVRADNDTVTGSGTANWSRALILNAGANTITVIAYDDSSNHNQRTQTLTIYYDIPDTTAPSLAITSHSNGQHVTSPNITLSGTASDSGKGDSGIQQVTVNGVRASGDTAVGSGTANWSRAITLNGGANTITVIAYDDSSNHNQATQIITIYFDPTNSAPSVTTGAATKVIPQSATLNGTINPNGLATTYYFQWGESTAYGQVTESQSLGAGWDPLAVSADLTGLKRNTLYHFRLVATNSLGTTSGEDRTFETSVKSMPWMMLLLGG
ncbi:MAG: hypothetical protein AB1585_14440 [Thermodesulfobacteriota bacterium]